MDMEVSSDLIHSIVFSVLISISGLVGDAFDGP